MYSRCCCHLFGNLVITVNASPHLSSFLPKKAEMKKSQRPFVDSTVVLVTVWDNWVNQDWFLLWETLLHTCANKCEFLPKWSQWWRCARGLLWAQPPGAEEDKGRSGQGWGTRPARGLTLKEVVNHSDYKVPRIVGSSGLIWQGREAPILGAQPADQGPEAEAPSWECCEDWDL